MILPIKIGSRASKLAIAQVREIIRLLGGDIPYELVVFETRGDKDKITPLTAQPADNFFTDALDEALIKGAIQVAVHSAKDLPRQIQPGLEIYALTKTIDDRDAWVGACAFKDLPKGANVGTSSLLRQKQIKCLRSDLNTVDIRGTIEERLALLKQGKVDGIVIAACALKRLGLEQEIKEILPWEGMALQGQLAVVGRSTDTVLRDIFKKIDVRLRYGNKKVLYLGTNPGLYQRLGSIIHWPMINVTPVVLDEGQRIKLIKDFTLADIIVITSRFGGECFLNAIAGEILSAKKFAVIGEHTAAFFRKRGITPFIIGKEETAEGLLNDILLVMDVKDKRILFPRSSLPNPFLKDALTEKGAQVTEWAIYENVKPPKRDLPAIAIDQVIFTSPSTVKNFIVDYATIPDDWDIIAKGPVTARALEDAGYKPTLLLT